MIDPPSGTNIPHGDGTQSPLGVSVPAHSLDTDGRVQFVNDAWVEVTGYDRSVCGERFASLLSEESADRFETDLAAAEDMLPTRSLELRRADGSSLSIVHEGGVERTAAGDVHRFHCQFKPERTAQDSGLLFQTVIDSFPVGVLAEATDGTVLSVNESLLSLFDVSATPEEIVGTHTETFADRIADRFAHSEAFLEDIATRPNEGEPVLGTRLSLTGGRTVERSYLPITLPEGQGHLWVYEDVTEIADRESQLRTYERLFEVAPVGVFRTTIEGSVLEVNQKLVRMLGYDSERRLHEEYSELGTDLYVDSERRETFVNRLREEGVVEGFEYEAVAAGGERRLLSMHARLLPETVDGEQVITGFTLDVTDRKKRERDLQTYEDIVQRLRDPIMLQDRAGNFQVVNEAVADYAGIAVEDLIGIDEYEFMDETAAGRIDQMKALALETEQPVEYEVDPTFEKRGNRSFKTLRYPYYDEAGDLAGTVAICRDVTEQKQRERQLAVLGRILRHNLRNAMTVIRGQAESLHSGADDRTARAIERIVNQTDLLMEQADKERTVTTALRQSTAKRVQDVTVLVDSAVSTVEADFPEATIEVEMPATARASVCAEFEQAVHELLDNAIRHTDTETPTVRVDVSTDDAHVEVRIADNGPGLPEMERNVLVGEAEVTPLYHGTGVGLWLVQWLVHLSEGHVSVTENEPQGSTVTIRLPRP